MATSPDTRDRILDTAEALFAEKGLAATSVRDIAAASDLTPASLYNHFEGKDALYAAVLQRSIEPLVEALEELSLGDGVMDLQEEILGRVMEQFGRHPNVPRLIYHEAVTGGTHLVPLTRAWIPPILARALSHMKSEGNPIWHEDDYRRVVAMWVQLVVGYFAVSPLLAEILDEDPLAPESIARQTRFMHQLSRALAAPASEGNER